MPGRDLKRIREDFLESSHYKARMRDLSKCMGIPFGKVRHLTDRAAAESTKLWNSLGDPNPMTLTRFYGSRPFLLTRMDDDIRKAPWRDEMLRFIDAISIGASVLDYGAGAGQYSMWLANKGCKVTATEIEGWMTKWMRWWFDRYRIDVTVKGIGNAADIDVLEDEKFDVVLLVAVLEHVPDPVGMAKMMMRHVKTGGKLFAVLGAFEKRAHLPESVKLMPEVKALLEGSKFIDAKVCMVTH